MSTVKKLVPEGTVDVCIQIFNKIKHLETGSSSILYDITSTYFYATRIPKVRFGHNKDENEQPQINISLVVTKNLGLPIFFRTYEGNISDVTTIQQLILDIKRINYHIEAIILDRGMTSRANVKALAASQIKIIGGIPLNSNEAKKMVEECKNKNSDCQEKEINAAIKGVSDYFKITNKYGKVTVVPDDENRKNARLRDGKCLIFTTDFDKPALEIISQYFGKDDIEKIFSCFKTWLEMQPIRHFDEGHIDVYIFICYLAYLAIALYKHRISSKGWEGVREGLDEMGRIRKTTLNVGGEKIEKLTVFTKEQKEILKKLGMEEVLFQM